MSIAYLRSPFAFSLDEEGLDGLENGDELLEDDDELDADLLEDELEDEDAE